MQKIHHRIIFGLGSNLGDRENNLALAVDALSAKLSLTNIKKSKILTNKALLKPNAPKEWDLDFFNIAVSGDINLHNFSPERILEITQLIEKQLGRKDNDSDIKWAPRKIDIDILAIDNLQIDLGEKLKIPHHALRERDFFLKTVAEIESEWLRDFINLA
ncbi:MAG: 2-amino-4-hydroxy-6-hydroxymethyldihydropteridine diphosphokinase [Rickettsiales bacterium]|nr:2-amino-4-hydroxy-6-hydroxymethyldihydropteridine diphosphokinase [Rickettsiales bacterium]